MADVSSKKRKSKDDQGSHKKKTKVTAAPTTTPQPGGVIKVSSIVQARDAPPVVGMFTSAIYPWYLPALISPTSHHTWNLSRPRCHLPLVLETAGKTAATP